MIIVSDSMTKLLNGWEIGKLILHVGTNDLSSEKSSVDIAKSKINLTWRLHKKVHDVSSIHVFQQLF